MKSGQYSVMGLVAGLNRYGYLAVDAATNLASNVLRPVMDMSLSPVGAGSFNPSFSSQSSSVSRIATDLQNGSPMQRQLEEMAALLNRNPENTTGELSGTLTVQVTNDKGEIIGVAQKAIRDLLRKESR